MDEGLPLPPTPLPHPSGVLPSPTEKPVTPPPPTPNPHPLSLTSPHLTLLSRRVDLEIQLMEGMGVFDGQRC